VPSPRPTGSRPLVLRDGKRLGPEVITRRQMTACWVVGHGYAVGAVTAIWLILGVSAMETSTRRVVATAAGVEQPPNSLVRLTTSVTRLR
jgi:hypothetical protein